MENINNKSPLDKAREKINEEGKKNLSKEVLEKNEENQRLDILFEKYVNLLENLKKIEIDAGESTSEVSKLSVEKNNLTSSQKQATEILKNDKNTAYLFDKDNIGDSEIHTKRKEIFDDVFTDSQNQKREIKKERKEKIKDTAILNLEKNNLKFALEEMKKSPDWIKLEEKKKEEILNANRDFNEFYRKNQKEISLYRSFKNVENFSKENEENIALLKDKLSSGFETLIKNTQMVFENAKNSTEYKPKDFGEIDFEKYRKFLPDNIEDIVFSIYSSDQGTLTFPQFDYNSEFYKTLYGQDISKLKDDIDTKTKEINQISGLFSGFKKKSLEKARDNLKAKEEFLLKILRSLNDKYIKDFNEIKCDIFNLDEYHNKIGYAVGRYVGGISRDVYPLDSEEKTFPEFNRNTNIVDLFKWTQDGYRPEGYNFDYKKVYDEYEEIRDLMSQKRMGYDLVAGDGATSRLRL